MQREALCLNERGEASDPSGKFSPGRTGIAQLRTCSAFSSTAGVPRLKWRGALNEQSSFCLIGNVALWSCQMKLRCRMIRKTKQAKWFRSCGYC